jgi:hypothetical protein
MKHLLRNINLLNILLFVAILIFVNYTILPFLNMNVRFTLPSGQQLPVYQDEKVTEGTIPSLTDYTLIAEDNLFHPERRIPIDTTENQPLEQPEFVLYGTLITDGVRVAYLEDLKSPRSTQGRGKRQAVVKIGDNMSGFTLKEIYPDKVIMVRGQDTMVVDLLDSSSKKARGSTAPSERPKGSPAHAPQKQKVMGRAISKLPIPMEQESQ